MRLVVWLLVLGGCRQIFGIDDTRVVDASAQQPDGPNGDADRSGRRKVITIDPNRVSADLLGFPLWVTLQDSDLALRARADGSDIYFVDPDGSPLPFERQAWDPTSGRVEAWVRVDLKPGLDTTFEIRYGEVAASLAPDPPAVFGADFVAVWHLEDALDTQDSSPIADARGMTPGATGGGLGPPAHVPAVLGAGIDFDGVDNQILFSNPLAGSGPHTISAWVNTRVSTDYESIVTVGNGTANQSRWFHARYIGDKVAVGMFNNDWADTGTVAMGGGWTLLHWVFEGSNRVSRLYRDGVEIGSHLHATGISTQGIAGYIGYAPMAWGSGGCGLDGVLDEVRIATVAHSAGYIQTEYANQSSPTTFYSVGPALPLP